MRNHGEQKIMEHIAKVLKEKNYQAGIIDSVKIHFRNEIKIKAFSDKGKQIEFVTSRLIIKEMLKEGLHIEGKYKE